jgi:hypothetical protein
VPIIRGGFDPEAEFGRVRSGHSNVNNWLTPAGDVFAPGLGNTVSGAAASGASGGSDEATGDPFDPDPARSTKAVAILMLGVAAVVTGPLVAGRLSHSSSPGNPARNPGYRLGPHHLARDRSHATPATRRLRAPDVRLD